MMEILYKKKVIRDFLSLYNEKYWTQLVSHVLEYGIILFKKKYTISALSPDDIYQIVENFKKDENIYDKKPLKKKTTSRPTSKNKTSFSSRSKEKNILSSSSKPKAGSSTKNIFKSKTQLSVNRKTEKERFSTSTNKNKSTNLSTLSKKSQTPCKQKQNDTLFKFNTAMNNKVKNVTSEKQKSKSRARMNPSPQTNVNTRKTILSMTNTSNLNSSMNKNNISLISAYSNYTTDNNNINNISTVKKRPSITIKTNDSDSKRNHPIEDKIIHYNNSTENDLVNNMTNSNKPIPPPNTKPKAESKIKELIERDKKKYIEQKYQGTMGKLNQIPILSNPAINKNVQETTINNQNEIIDETPQLPLKNESSIISLEDKLNGLTMKLSKLNASINNTKNNYYSSSLSSTNKFPSYLNNMDNTNNVHSNIVTTTENNDEDYLGEDQIDLNQNHNTIEEDSNSGNVEMRFYRKMNSNDE